MHIFRNLVFIVNNVAHYKHYVGHVCGIKVLRVGATCGIWMVHNINKNNKSDCEKAGNMILYNQGGKF